MLHQQHHDAAIKFSYFLLTATGASIGFAVQKLDGQSFTFAGITLLAGTGAWLLSFLCGLLALEANNVTKGFNLQRQMFEGGNHTLSKRFKSETEELRDVVMEWVANYRRRARLLTIVQSVFLGIRATCVVAWRNIEMLDRC
ncbi:hypothetical protein C1931_12135 [Stenotrophomonas sp. YAU14A_MKIMI4_1]|nr:hypothetical protein C1931_12135 [Stenotrophomonas sp. YAU14A_MKIMI4_1]